MGQNTFQAGRVGIVCLGLMGGSFAKAYAAKHWEVYGWNRSRETLDFALIETLTGELTDEIIPTCELIVLAGYPAMSIEWLESHADLIAKGALVIDTVGVKREVCKALWPIAEKHGFHFIGAHPMAGTQFSGFAHARADMFVGAPMVLVPEREGDVEELIILDRLEELLRPLGFGSFTITSADEHDKKIAFTSQLAHVVSNAYVKSPTAQTHAGFSAGSYKDLTRVAHLNAPMWTELFLDNADNLVREIDTIITHLAAYRDTLAAHDADTLESLLAEGDAIKRTIDPE